MNKILVPLITITLWMGAAWCDPTPTPTVTATPTLTQTATPTPTATSQLPSGWSYSTTKGIVNFQYGDQTLSHPLIDSTLKASWVSNATGEATVLLNGMYGVVNRISWVPGTGDDAPSADYDCTIRDVDDWDICQAYGANLSATTTECYVLPTGVQIAGSVTIEITHAGDSKKGIVRLYLYR